jgi:hypothetical protein
MAIALTRRNIYVFERLFLSAIITDDRGGGDNAMKSERERGHELWHKVERDFKQKGLWPLLTAMENPTNDGTSIINDVLRKQSASREESFAHAKVTAFLALSSRFRICFDLPWFGIPHDLQTGLMSSLTFNECAFCFLTNVKLQDSSGSTVRGTDVWSVLQRWTANKGSRSSRWSGQNPVGALSWQNNPDGDWQIRCR